MFGMRRCLALGLLGLRAAAGVDDESCLVQSQKDVVSQRDTALTLAGPDAPDVMLVLHKVPNSMKYLDLAVRNLAKQFPGFGGGMPSIPGLPGGLGGGAGGGVGGMSMEDMMALAQEMLALLKDKKMVDLIYESIDNATTGLLGTSATMLTAAGKFDAAMDDSANNTQVLEALKGFLTTLETEAANSIANVTVNGRKLWARVPSNNTLKAQLESTLNMTASLTKPEVVDFVKGAIDPELLRVVQDETTFCDTIRPYTGNISESTTVVRTQGESTLEMAKGMLPQVEAMVKMVAPDVAPTVVDLANATLASMERVYGAYRESIPAVNDALLKVINKKFKCRIPGAQSGAPLARASFATVLAAVVAWMVAA